MAIHPDGWDRHGFGSGHIVLGRVADHDGSIGRAPTQAQRFEKDGAVGLPGAELPGDQTEIEPGPQSEEIDLGCLDIRRAVGDQTEATTGDRRANGSE